MTQPMAKTPAIIVDIDGTCCHMCDRGIFEHEKAINDTPNMAVITTIRGLATLGYDIIFCSGRFEQHRDVTERWLRKYLPGLGYARLLMRKDGDRREDSIVKEELYRTLIEPYYDVLLVLDDRTRVVNMWRSIDLVCFQVAPGDF